MDKNSIITLPNNHLRQRSKKVGIINTSIHKIILNMKKATLDWEDSREHEAGVALAAIQIDKLLRIIVIRDDFDDKKNRDFLVFINPKITKYEGEVTDDFEGCLSIKDVYGKVPRHTKIRITATNEDGTAVRTKVEGFLARVFQHEIDHINGKMFIDHIKDDPKAFYKLGKGGELEKLNYDDDVKNNSILW